MDINKITDFLAYIPYLEENSDVLMHSILNRLPYLSDKEKQQTLEAYLYARSKHKDVKRLSWEAYIVHPLRVLEFLIPLHPDVATIQSALMHDLIEDTEVTYEDIESRFGEDVAWLCEGLVKVSTVRRSGEERQLETLKKTFLAMGKDLRVIFIKIADRVHNIQTLHYHPTQEKRERIALETIKVYVPIAKRLWLYVLQWYLENWSFAQLEPTEYQKIAQYVHKHYSWWDNYKNVWIQRLDRLFSEENIEYELILWRVKSPYRIRKKLQKYQSSDISKIMDILAFRIITQKVSDCYTILWIIHKHYTPIFAKMKDYIAIPKPNWYKSLHTTILWMFDFPVEVQVRTQKMDQVANYWVAAHFSYSDEDSGPNPIVSDKQQEWIERLQEIVTKFKKSPNKEAFKDELNIELLQQTIFVYTPKGDIIELPMKSSVLDFAFRVHTDVWLRFKNAHVNWKIVPIDYRLKTWDIVAISTFKMKVTANSSRLRNLSTPWAKTKLQKFLRHQERKEIFERVEKKINEKLTFYELPALYSKEDRITKVYQWNQYEWLLYRVYDGQYRITRLLKEVYSDKMKEKDVLIIDKQEEVMEAVLSYNSEIVIDWHGISNSVLCPECTPSPWNRVIARSWKDGIKIHTVKCNSLDTINTKKLLEAHWKWEKARPYTVSFQVTTDKKPWVLLQLLRIVERFGLSIWSLQSTENNKWTHSEISFEIVFTNPSTVWYFVERILEKAFFKTVETSFLAEG